MDNATWTRLLSEIRPLSISIEGLLRSSKPLSFDGKKIKIEVSYKFHKDKLEESKNRKMIEDIAGRVFQNQVILECLVSETPVQNPSLTNVSNQNIITVAEEMFS